MLALALCFLIGCCQILWLTDISVGLLYSCCTFLFISFILNVKYKQKLFSCSISFFLGFTLCLYQCLDLKVSQLKRIPNQSVVLNGKVIGLPIEKPDKVKFIIEVDENDFGLKKILTTWYKNSSNNSHVFITGQRWKLTLKLKPNHHNFNPGSFDYSKWLFRNKIDSTATVKAAEFLEIGNVTLLNRIDQFRSQISKTIEKEISSVRIQAFIRALTIGDKNQISFNDSKLFRQTGTSHIVAISGLHIGLVAIIGMIFGRILYLIFPNESPNRLVYEVIFAMAFAIFYTFLAGFSVSTVRALIMLAVFLYGYIFKWPITRWQSWSLALILVLIIDPLNVLDAGFWLSFMAVAILIFSFSGKQRIKNKLFAFSKAQIVILIGLLPFTILIFGEVNLLTPFTNFIVLPIASLLIIPLIFISFLMSLLSDTISHFIFNITEVVCYYFFYLLDQLSKIQLLTFDINNSGLNVMLFIFISSVLLLPSVFRWKYWVLLLLFPLFFQKRSQLKEHEFLVSVLDVGQGLSVIIETRNHTLIYDTGLKSDSGFNMAQSVILPFLKTKNLYSIDKIIVSHDDKDHSGGIENLINQFPLADIYGVKGQFKLCDINLNWSWDGIKFEILSPYQIVPYLGNNSSCVIKISNTKFSILLSGDIEEPVEYRLVKNNTLDIKSNVLLVPHHGSKTSSSVEFIKQVDPQIAINSSGFVNQFNHPHPMIKKRYLKENIDFLDTQNSGMIQLHFTQKSIDISEYKKNHSKIWFVNPESS